LRRALGDDVTLMADANEKLSTHDAAWAIDVLGELGVRWLEEPVDAIAWPVLAAMHRSSMPIAFGEHVRSLDEFDELLSRSPFDILQTDASISGGITQAGSIVDAAARAGLRVVAHNAAGPLAFAANLHLAAASGADELLEYPFPVAAFWRALTPGASFADVRDGQVTVDDAPGLGLTVDPDVLDRFTVARHEVALAVAVDDMLGPLGVAP
jgi:L-alanine-DL-glutamate epimerase-like enolase superfamily enzyme